MTDVGRPTKCTPEVIEAFCAAIRRGATRTLAAQASGIGRKTLYRWLENAESEADADAPYRHFRHAVELAEAELFNELSEVVLTAAKTDPKYALLYLERRLPGDWSPTRKLEHGGPDGGPIRSEGTARVILLPALEPEDDPAPPL